MSFREPVESALYGASLLGRSIDGMKEVYAALKIQNQLTDGTIAYPSDKSVRRGMSLEARYVPTSLLVPLAESTIGMYLSHTQAPSPTSMLCEMFHSPSKRASWWSSLVLMAAVSAFQNIQAEGVQISPTGKSTIIKLLTRLYDVASGEILIDGKNIKEYNLEDLKRATANLTQDHTVFPLSVAENVGLGDPSCVSDMDAITESTRKGGADHFIGKFSDGSQTVLDVETYGYCTAVADHPLQKEWRKLPKKVDISGIFLSALCKTQKG